MTTLSRLFAIVLTSIVLQCQLAAASDLRGSPSAFFSVCCAPDNCSCVTGGQDGVVRLWHLVTGTELRAYGSQNTPVTAVNISPNGKMIAGSWTDNDSGQSGVILWDISGKEHWRQLGHTMRVISIAFSPDSQIVLSAGGSTICCRNTSDGKLLRVLRSHQGDINCISTSADGRYLLSAGGDYSGGELRDASMRIWDLRSGTLLRCINDFDSPVESITVSRDSRLVASGDCRGLIRLWEVDGWKELASCKADEPVASLCFGPENNILLSAGGYASGPSINHIRLWEVPSGRPLPGFPDMVSGPNALALSNDGVFAVSVHGYFSSKHSHSARDSIWNPTMSAGIEDAVVRVWAIRDRKQCRTIPK